MATDENALERNNVRPPFSLEHIILIMPSNKILRLFAVDFKFDIYRRLTRFKGSQNKQQKFELAGEAFYDRPR